MAGFGGCIGYMLCAINWDQTIFGSIIGDNIKTVFTLVTVIFICAMLLTITSFREIPLKLIESDQMLRPITQIVIEKEKERLKAIALTTVSFESEVNSSQRPSSSHETSNEILKPINGSVDDQSDEPVTLLMYLKSIVFMPKPLRILCITNLLSWMGHILYCLYFTDFVGEVVFGGDPAASIDTPAYKVRMT